MFIRLADGRRDDELPGDVPEDVNVSTTTVITDYLQITWDGYVMYQAGIFVN